MASSLLGQWAPPASGILHNVSPSSMYWSFGQGWRTAAFMSSALMSGPHSNSRALRKASKLSRPSRGLTSACQ
eukprot:652389-Prorocentrum_lima.AAC.1